MGSNSICRIFLQNKPVVIARTFNIIGPGISQSLAIGAFAKKIKSANDGDCITTNNLNTRRDYLGIDDVCDAYWQLLTNRCNNLVYNICSGKSILMEDIIKAMIDESGKNITIQQNNSISLSSSNVLDIYGDNSHILIDTNWYPKQSVIKIARKMIKNRY